MCAICVKLVVVNCGFKVAEGVHNRFAINALKKDTKTYFQHFVIKNIPLVIRTLLSSVLLECDGVGRQLKYTAMLQFTANCQVAYSLPCIRCKMVNLFSSWHIIRDFCFLSMNKAKVILSVLLGAEDNFLRNVPTTGS